MFKAFDTFYGYRVQVVKDMPKMTLNERVPVTPEFRAEFNTWLLEFFGTINVVEDDVVYRIEETGTMIMNPRTFAQLKLISK